MQLAQLQAFKYHEVSKVKAKNTHRRNVVYVI